MLRQNKQQLTGGGKKSSELLGGVTNISAKICRLSHTVVMEKMLTDATF